MIRHQLPGRTSFVKLRINGVFYEAIWHVLKSHYGLIGRFRIWTGAIPIINGCAREMIYGEWLEQEWFIESVPDFQIRRTD